jgi:hypothetical protein
MERKTHSTDRSTAIEETEDTTRMNVGGSAGWLLREATRAVSFF